MTDHNVDLQDPADSSEESYKISYQTNKIPWWIHVMWASFALFSVIYLLKFALKDFLLWW